MTNLIASIIVTLVTNTTSTDNAIYAQIPNPCTHMGSIILGRGITCALDHGFTQGDKIAEATEKIEVQKVYKVTSSMLTFNGTAHVHELERSLQMSIRCVLHRKSEWSEVYRDVSSNRSPFENQTWAYVTNYPMVLLVPKIATNSLRINYK